MNNDRKQQKKKDIERSKARQAKRNWGDES
jgi:hypothetical protein